MTFKEKIQAFSQKAGKALKVFAITVLVLALALFLFMYFGNYSEDFRAGYVQKLSKRGNLFKTWEGELLLDQHPSTDSTSNVFFFSVNSDDQAVILALEAAAIKGERISIRYVEKYMHITWRGETKFFVKEVKPLSSDSIK